MTYKLSLTVMPEFPEAPVAVVEPNDKPIGGFLTSSVYNDEAANWYIEAIDKVLSNISDFEERDGEIFGISIKRDVTRVYDIYSEDETKTIETFINTEELKQLIRDWQLMKKDYLGDIQ